MALNKGNQLRRKTKKISKYVLIYVCEMKVFFLSLMLIKLCPVLLCEYFIVVME